MIQQLPPDLKRLRDSLPKKAGTQSLQAMRDSLPTAGDYAQSVVSGLGRGLTGTIEGALTGAYRVAHAVLPEWLQGPEPEDESILQALHSVTESFQPVESVQRAGGARQFLAETLPEGLGSTGAFLLPGGAAARLGRGAQLGASALAGAMVGAEQGYKEVLASTGDERKAWTAFVLNLPGGATEALDIGIAGNLFKWDKKTGGLLKGLLIDAGAEGLQEGAQGALSDVIHEKLTGEEREKLRRFASNALLGTAVGGILGGTGRALRGEGTTEGPSQGPVADQAIAPGAPGYVPPEPEAPAAEPTGQLVGMEGVTARPVEPAPNPSESPNTSEPTEVVPPAAAPPEPAPPVDPLEKVVQEMQLTQSRIRNLEGQAKLAKQKGQTEKGFAIDKDLLKLKDKLRGHAEQFQEIAAERRGPEATSKEIVPVETISSYDQAQQEIETIEARLETEHGRGSTTMLNPDMGVIGFMPEDFKHPPWSKADTERLASLYEARNRFYEAEKTAMLEAGVEATAGGRASEETRRAALKEIAGWAEQHRIDANVGLGAPPPTKETVEGWVRMAYSRVARDYYPHADMTWDYEDARREIAARKGGRGDWGVNPEKAVKEAEDLVATALGAKGEFRPKHVEPVAVRKGSEVIASKRAEYEAFVGKTKFPEEAKAVEAAPVKQPEAAPPEAPAAEAASAQYQPPHETRIWVGPKGVRVSAYSTPEGNVDVRGIGHVKLITEEEFRANYKPEPLLSWEEHPPVDEIEAAGAARGETREDLERSGDLVMQRRAGRKWSEAQVRIGEEYRAEKARKQFQPVAAEAVQPAKPTPKPKPKSIGQKAKLRAETKDLQSFVRSIGGIRGDTPEGRLLYGGLGDKEVGKKFGLGPIVRSPKSVKGLNWEHAKEQAFEAGFFPQHESSGDVTFRDFADALTENAKHPEEMERFAESEYDAYVRRLDEADAAQMEGAPESFGGPTLDVPAEMPKGEVIGYDINGDPLYSKLERGDVGRIGEGIEQPEQSQVGMFDEQGGLFEAQAEQRDAGSLEVQQVQPEAEGEASLGGFPWEEDLRDSIIIKGESPPVAEHYVRAVREVSDELGEPPGPPRPPAPPQSIPAPLDDPVGSDRIDRWIGEKQLAHADAERKAGAWKRAIDRTLAPSIGRFLKERLSLRSNRARFQIEEAGQLAIDLQGKLDAEYAKFGATLTPEQKAVLERARNLTPEQKAILADVVVNNLELSKLALREEVISTYFETYTKRLWKGNQVAGETPSVPRGPAKFTTFTTGALPRSYSSILEGWSVGNDLNVKSFADAAAWNEKAIADVVANRNLIEDGRKAGWLRTGAQNLDGWVRIEHPNFTDEVLRAKIASPESAETLRDALSGHLDEEIPLEEAVKVYGRAREGKTSMVAGRDMRIIPRGNDILVFQKMPLFAPAKEAHLINNVLGKSGITEYVEQGSKMGRVVGAVDKFGVIAKTMRTAGINDNIVFIAMRNFGAQPGSSIKTALDTVTFAPYRAGQKMIEMWGPDIQRGISEGGLRFTPTADMQPFFELQRGKLQTKLEGMKITGAPARFISNTYLDLQNFLYGRFIPAYKANLYMLELARLRKVSHADLLSGKVKDEALVRAAAQLSNNVLSGQNWQKMGVNPTAMHMAQIAFLAPDRMTSNIRIASDAFRAGAMGTAHRALWARMASRYTFLWVASNFAMAGLADDDESIAKRLRKNFTLGLREGFALDVSPVLDRIGRKNPSRLFVQLNAQASEAVEGAPDPFGYLRRKVGILPNMAFGLGTGENFFGQRYTTGAELTGQDDRGLYKTTRLGRHYRGEEKGGRLAGKLASYQSGAQPGHIRPEQFPSFAISQVPIPFELQAWVETVAGETDAFEAALQTLGFRTMSPSAKRQQEAGIGEKPTLDFDALWKEAVGQ